MATSVLNDVAYLSSYGRTFYVNFNYPSPSYDPHVESRTETQPGLGTNDVHAHN